MRLGTYEQLIRVELVPIPGMPSGSFFADFAIHSGVVLEISGWIFVLVSLPDHILYAASFEVDYLIEYDSQCLWAISRYSVHKR